jgi:pimeloyl-ACP methyl ester carboxylesterase
MRGVDGPEVGTCDFDAEPHDGNSSGRTPPFSRATGEPASSLHGIQCLSDVSDVARELTRVDGLALTAARPARAVGAPLLFIHGLFAAGWMFEHWLGYFAQRGRPAYAVDLRGHGASDDVPDRGRVALHELVTDARRAAGAVGRPLVVVGHSMGALVAQKLAELDPPAALILVSPAPPRGIPPLSLRLVVRQARYLPALLRSREFRVRRGDADDMILNRVPPADRAAAFSRFEPDSGRVGREIMLGAVAVDARQVRCPVLVLAGEDDRFIPLRVARRVAAKYRASLRVLPRRAHLMMQEPGWEEAAAEIERWLRERNL